MLYENYIKRLSKRYLTELESIKVGYNFDFGDEYEIAVCRVLRLFLPTKYGVCRGFIVASDGERVGDDIIIYDKSKFPTLGLRDENDLSRKEFIPVEAVLGYIEAKNTLDEDTLPKALKQVSDAKSLCLKRKKVNLGQLDGVEIDQRLLTTNNNFPDYKNPPWGAIISNNVNLQSNEIRSTIEEAHGSESQLPDLILCDSDKVLTPVFLAEPGGVDTLSSFSMKDRTTLRINQKDGLAPGIAMTSLLAALDWLKLGDVSWKAVVVDALNDGREQ